MLGQVSWEPVISAVGSILGSAVVLAAVFKWGWRWFVRDVAAAVHRIEHKVTSNGGQDLESVGTRAVRIEREVRALKVAVREINRRLSNDGRIH